LRVCIHSFGICEVDLKGAFTFSVTFSYFTQAFTILPLSLKRTASKYCQVSKSFRCLLNFTKLKKIFI